MVGASSLSHVRIQRVTMSLFSGATARLAAEKTALAIHNSPAIFYRVKPLSIYNRALLGVHLALASGVALR
eukprot:3290477-Lingulodinium_polyedra.AAC.1